MLIQFLIINFSLVNVVFDCFLNVFLNILKLEGNIFGLNIFTSEN